MAQPLASHKGPASAIGSRAHEVLQDDSDGMFKPGEPHDMASRRGAGVSPDTIGSQ